MTIMLKVDQTIADMFNHRDLKSGETWDEFTRKRNFHPADRLHPLEFYARLEAHRKAVTDRATQPKIAKS